MKVIFIFIFLFSAISYAACSGDPVNVDIKFETSNGNQATKISIIYQDKVTQFGQNRTQTTKDILKRYEIEDQHGLFSAVLALRYIEKKNAPSTTINYSKFAKELTFARGQLAKYLEELEKSHAVESHQVKALMNLITADSISSQDISQAVGNLLRRMNGYQYNIKYFADGKPEKGSGEDIRGISVGPMSGEFSERLVAQRDDRCRTAYKILALPVYTSGGTTVKTGGGR